MVTTSTQATVEALEKKPGMSLDEYLARGEERFEIIDGEEIAMSPTVHRHDRLKQQLFLVLHNFVIAHKLGSMLVGYTFIDPDAKQSRWVCGSITPDIMFYSGTRLTDYDLVVRNTTDDDLPIAMIPDLVIEIISPTDRRRNVSRKIDYLLDLGVQTVWAINPLRQSVIIYTSDADPLVLTGAMNLSTDLLPGWSIAVKTLFSAELGN